jgi:tellurite resistance protein TehA-like permease
MKTRLDADRPGALASLNPGVFAIVMGTGICSIAAWQQRYLGLADAMLWLNGIIYVILWVLVALQLVVNARRFAQNFIDHVRLPGVLTVVAGTGVLGSEFIIIAGWNALATALWLLAVALWLALTYAFFFIVITRPDKPTLERGIDGLWLLAVVSTQSLAVLGALIATTLGEGRTGVLFLSLAFWLAGGMCYLLIITLIFYRLAFFGVTPETLTAPYWINMGALAITTLAGTTLALRAPQWAVLASLLPFIKGFTLFFWAAGTWWIPLLVLLGVWRHVSRGRLPEYDLQYWGIIFPLGMYTACTYNLAKVLNLEFLSHIPQVSVFVALVAWALLFGALLHNLWGDAARRLRERRSSRLPSPPTGVPTS